MRTANNRAGKTFDEPEIHWYSPIKKALMG